MPKVSIRKKIGRRRKRRTDVPNRQKSEVDPPTVTGPIVSDVQPSPSMKHEPGPSQQIDVLPSLHDSMESHSSPTSPSLCTKYNPLNQSNDGAATPIEEQTAGVSLISISETTENICHLIKQHDSLAIVYTPFAGGTSSHNVGEHMREVMESGVKVKEKSLPVTEMHQITQTVEADVLQTVPPPSEQGTTLLEKVRNNLLLFMSQGWEPMIRNGGIHLAWYTDSDVLMVRRSLFIRPDGVIVPSVHGKILPSDHTFYRYPPPERLRPDSVKEFSQNLVKIWKSFRLMEICKGVEAFESLWKTIKDGEVDRNLFQETRYKTTFRPNECALLVPSLKNRRCKTCNKMFDLLRHRAAVQSSVTLPQRKPNECLNAPQKSQRVELQSGCSSKKKRENRRLKRKLEELVHEEGVALDEGFLDDNDAQTLSCGQNATPDYRTKSSSET